MKLAQWYISWWLCEIHWIVCLSWSMHQTISWSTVDMLVTVGSYGLSVNSRPILCRWITNRLPTYYQHLVYVMAKAHSAKMLNSEIVYTIILRLKILETFYPVLIVAPNCLGQMRECPLPGGFVTLCLNVLHFHLYIHCRT